MRLYLDHNAWYRVLIRGRVLERTTFDATALTFRSHCGHNVVAMDQVERVAPIRRQFAANDARRYNAPFHDATDCYLAKWRPAPVVVSTPAWRHPYCRYADTQSGVMPKAA